MNSLRSIVVHVDSLARCELRLRIAHQLANAFGARLTALYAVTPTAYETPFVLVEGAASLLPALERIDRERQEQARALFDRVVAGAADTAAPAVWVDAGREPSYVALDAHAMLADLIVLGQHDPSTGQASADTDLAASTLIASGAPGLVVPYAGPFDAATLAHAGCTVLLAWKPTREAAHAARAALPWLQRARRIHLAVETPAHGDHPVPGVSELRAWLALHGCAGAVQHRFIERDSAGEMLLSMAADASADLLVMGCFGHSRARELVLGGASHTILQSMTLPVLMAH